MNQVWSRDRQPHTGENMSFPERSSLVRLTGIFLLLASLGWVAAFFLGGFLGVWGDPSYEDHAAIAFAAYQQNPVAIPLMYDGSMLVGVLFIALAPLLYLYVARSQTPLKLLAAIFQVLAGLIHALAASRWVIMLPIFAQTYADPQTSAATRAAIDVTYQSISYFLGLTLGEHFYFIFTGCWSLLLALSLLWAPGEKRWRGWLGIVAGTFLLLASLEQLNFSFSDIFLYFMLVGMLLWLIWTVSLALTLLTSPRAANP